jgi:glycine oxidase
VKSWDVTIIGGGIIGLSLAISLRKEGLRVLIVERGEPGREASYAAAGMLAASGEIPPPLKGLAEASAQAYPEFVHELQDESGIKVDLRDQGSILLSRPNDFPTAAEPLSPVKLRSLEPALEFPPTSEFSRRASPRLDDASEICAAYLGERSVDPRALLTAAIKAAHHRQVDIASGTEVKSLLVDGGRVRGVQTDRSAYSAAMVVNCAGAWAGNIAPHDFPVRPVKGQMLAVVGGPAVEHVIRSEDVYLVPRTDGRLLIGSTLEEAGFNKQTDVNTLRRLFQSAVRLVPGLANSRKHEAWAGLRPGTPDELPTLGHTSTSGFFVASGHYRDGILLAPITARVLTALIMGKSPGFDLQPFSPERFVSKDHRDRGIQRNI